MNTKTIRTIVIPHGVKVAIFITISACLTVILNSLSSWNLSADQQMIIMGIINIILAALKKYQDEEGGK